jgi:hypothetical protein
MTGGRWRPARRPLATGESAVGGQRRPLGASVGHRPAPESAVGRQRRPLGASVGHRLDPPSAAESQSRPSRPSVGCRGQKCAFFFYIQSDLGKHAKSFRENNKKKFSRRRQFKNLLLLLLPRWDLSYGPKGGRRTTNPAPDSGDGRTKTKTDSGRKQPTGQRDSVAEE